MQSVKKPWWQQATALVSLSTGGAITGLSFVPGTPAQLSTPVNLPVHLLALQKSAQPAQADDTMLRTAIVNVAKHYLEQAKTRTPAEMQTMIWGKDSIDGADHGPTCAAFASLTLELAAKAVGQQSWVTGGSTYPWPLHDWADVRVDPNPDSLQIVSIQQDAQAHDRWHPLGDGYTPQPGDWIMFDGHVEVVTGTAGGQLQTIGGDSLPDLSVNAHQYAKPLDAQGVTGFVDNGVAKANGSSTPAAGQPSTPAQGTGSGQASGAGHRSASGKGSASGHGSGARKGSASRQSSGTGKGSGSGREPGPAHDSGAAQVPGAELAGTSGAQIPGMSQAGPVAGSPARSVSHGSHRTARAAAPRSAAAKAATGAGGAAVPGATGGPASAASAPAASAPAAKAPANKAPANKAAAHAKQRPAYGRSSPGAVQAPLSSNQQAFINAVAPGAIAAQSRYGVPASVTIAQAIDESGWGQSKLAADYHNLFGIKGTGPAGSVQMPTQEYENGKWISTTAPFRVYHNVAESISDHGELLATSGYYQRAMADRKIPDAFAADLTGVYATDPGYGGHLITLMQLYDLYRYDAGSATAAPPAQTAPASPRTSAPRASAPRSAVPGTKGRGPAGGAPATGKSGANVPGMPQLTAARVVAPAARRPARHGPGYSTGRRGAGVTQHGASSPYAAAARRAGATQVVARNAWASAGRYQQRIPQPVATAYITMAKTPLARAEPLYRDVAACTGIHWELLAACDWMQCQARPRFSPVHGEKLGTVNPDGTAYHTKSQALAQCASDMTELARAVYGIDLTAGQTLSVRALASVFAAFRWGGLLQTHGISAMEFPYSVEGLTAQHVKMRWPVIGEPNAPDKPGAKFRLPFGAVPVVLGLDYPATA